MTQPNTKTPAMVLQEFTVKRGCSPPEYVLAMSKMGTHENEFHYKVSVADVSAMGFGRSKQVAKHNAATKALEILAEQGLYDPRSNPAQEFKAQSHRNESDSPLQPPVNFVGNLKDTCCEYKLPYPDFVAISDVGPPHAREFTYECRVASITTQATANTKKQAKQLAARDMLEEIKVICPQLAEQCASSTNALTDKDHEAITKYNELWAPMLNIIPNKAIYVSNFHTTIKKIMMERDLQFADFEEQFQIRSKDGIDEIFDKLDVKYKIEIFQDLPPLACAVVGLETPFTIIELGETVEEAKMNVVKQMYEYLFIFMNVEDSDVTSSY